MKKVLYSLLASAIVAAFAFISITNNVLPPEKVEATEPISSGATAREVQLEKITFQKTNSHTGVILHYTLRKDTGALVTRAWYNPAVTFQLPDNVSDSDFNDAMLAYITLHYNSTTVLDISKDINDFLLNYNTIIKSAEFQSYLSPKVVLEKVTIHKRPNSHTGTSLQYTLRYESSGARHNYSQVFTFQLPDNVSDSDFSDAVIAYITLHYHSTNVPEITEGFKDFARDYNTIIKSAEFKDYLQDTACSELELERALKASIYPNATANRPTLICKGGIFDTSSLFTES